MSQTNDETGETSLTAAQVQEQIEGKAARRAGLLSEATRLKNELEAARDASSRAAAQGASEDERRAARASVRELTDSVDEAERGAALLESELPALQALLASLGIAEAEAAFQAEVQAYDVLVTEFDEQLCVLIRQYLTPGLARLQQAQAQVHAAQRIAQYKGSKDVSNPLAYNRGERQSSHLLVKLLTNLQEFEATGKLFESTRPDSPPVSPDPQSILHRLQPRSKLAA